MAAKHNFVVGQNPRGLARLSCVVLPLNFHFLIHTFDLVATSGFAPPALHPSFFFLLLSSFFSGRGCAEGTPTCLGPKGQCHLSMYMWYIVYIQRSNPHTTLTNVHKHDVCVYVCMHACMHIWCMYIYVMYVYMYLRVCVRARTRVCMCVCE